MIFLSLTTTISPSIFFPEPHATNQGTGALLTWGQTIFSRSYFHEPIGTNFVSQPVSITQLPISDTTFAPVIISSIAGGGAHSLISTTEGEVYSAGANFHGQLGLSDFFDRPQLTPVSLLRNAPGAYYNGTQWVESMGRQNVVKVAAGHDQSAALTDQGKLFVWGNNAQGQLGLGCAPVPQSILLDSWDDLTNPAAASGGAGAKQLPSANPNSYRPIATDTQVRPVAVSVYA
jgi:hypothetical protein